MFKQLAIWFSFPFERPDCFDRSRFVRESVAVDNRPVVSSLVVGDFVSMASTKDILSSCFIAFRNVKCETIVGSNIRSIHEMVNDVECTIVQLIHLMIPIHGLFGKGQVGTRLVVRHRNVGGHCHQREQPQTHFSCGQLGE